MKILVRYLGMTIEKVELSPGTYVLGRSQECDIVLTQEFISRKHGKIWFENDKWYFQDLREDHPDFSGQAIELNQNTSIDLGHDVDLITEDYLEHAETNITNVHNLKDAVGRSRTNRRVILGLSLALIFLIGSGITFYAYQRLTKPMDPNTLLTFVRSKIVEFERVRNEEAVKDYKKYGGLEDKDFKDKSGFCTGFIIAPDVVLTASHCLFGQLIIDMDAKFKIKTSDDKKHDVKRILGFDIKKDFLFLEVPGLKEYGFLNISGDYQVGQKVFTVGNVHGEGIAIRDGIMASETSDPNDPEIKFVRYSAAASPGNSGGPLVDEYGNVVALVFAGTWTENYNLGTSADYLLQGKRKFVTNRKEKDVSIEFRKLLNYSPRWLLERLSFPHNSNFDENPETLRAMENVLVDVKVPTEVDPFPEIVLNKINDVVRIKFEQITKSLDDQGIVSLGWNSFVTAETPIIIPSQFDKSQTKFKLLEDGQLVPKQAALLDTPSPKDFNQYKKKLDEQKKFDFQSYGYMMDHFEKAKGELSDKEIIYATGPFDSKKRIWSYVFGVPYSQVKYNYSSSEWQNVRSFPFDLFLKNFIGEKGIIANSFSPLVRPKSSREFTIKEIDEQIETTEIKDLHGREWIRHSFSMFDRLTFDVYCIKLPQGAMCISKMFPTLDKVLLSISRANYIKYWLPNYLINPFFWSVDSLIDYQGREESNGPIFMRDFKVKKSNRNQVTVSLESLGLEFTLPSDMELVSMRPNTGLLGDDQNQKWVSLGLEALFKTKKNKYKVCGMGVEIDGTFSNHMLSLYREGKKKQKSTQNQNAGKKEGDKKNEPDEYPEVFIKSDTAKKAGRQISVYGYCAPVQKDPLIEDTYEAKLSRAEKLEVNYRQSHL
jgi:S1-C subfamily serine protease